MPSRKEEAHEQHLECALQFALDRFPPPLSQPVVTAAQGRRHRLLLANYMRDTGAKMDKQLAFMFYRVRHCDSPLPPLLPHLLSHSSTRQAFIKHQLCARAACSVPRTQR